MFLSLDINCIFVGTSSYSEAHFIANFGRSINLRTTNRRKGLNLLKDKYVYHTCSVVYHGRLLLRLHQNAVKYSTLTDYATLRKIIPSLINLLGQCSACTNILTYRVLS